MDEFQRPLVALVEAVKDGTVTGAPASWTAADRLLAAILIDQMSRNWAAIDTVPTIVQHGSDPAALAFARSVAAECFEAANASGLKCALPFFCFFTLVFRHSSEEGTIDRSIRLLQRALDGEFPDLEMPLDGPDRALCERFLTESKGKRLTVQCERYIASALENDVPSLLGDEGSRDDEPLDMRVLDDICREMCMCPADFLEAFTTKDRESQLDKLRTHSSVVAMEEALRRDHIGPADTLLLSLSGGVDSTAHAVMLMLLQPTFGFTIGALHMHHLNREDAVEEQRWVHLLAQRIGLPLLSYTIRLQRPHGDNRTGITRERYEDVTKRIRFRMYQLGLDTLAGQSDGRDGRRLVVLGHHQDDADENRLAELGKGNLVDVDGMGILSNCLGIMQYRPLLQTRKQAMYDLARAARIPFMADSTPLWSRRGWTRRVLDGIGAQDELLRLLEELGVCSAELGRDLLRVGTDLTSQQVVSLKDWPPAGKLSGSLADDVTLSLVAAVRLADLSGMGQRVDVHLTQVRNLATKIAAIWNPAIKELGRLKDEDALPPCPLQPVQIHDRDADAGVFAFVHAAKRHFVTSDILPFLNGGQVAAKSLTHILSMMRRSKDTLAPVWSTLNSRCPCVWIPAIDTLVLYDFRLMTELTRAATMKRTLIEACIRQLGQPDQASQ